MSATDELRRMLDERSIHWWAGEGELDRKTHWESGGLTWEYFNDENGDAWLGFLGACESDITPEQAIAATLGAGTCKVEGSYYSELMDVYVFSFSCRDSIWWNDEEPPNYCPDCGRKVKG